jgi:hypothetical protein
MIVETAQMLSTAFPNGIAPYKHTHVNHPCNVWMRASLSNYRWLLAHGLELCVEYTRRYGKVHKTETVAFDWFLDNEPDIKDIGLTPFAIAIKDKSLHKASVVESYRTYYIIEKVKFAKWAPRAKLPTWWPHKELNANKI